MLATPLMRVIARTGSRAEHNHNKMGASLDTPTRCPLCNEQTGKPVTLRCNHRFCQRCIGDLWSISPNGPYCCPEFRCKTVYKTLPFDRSLIVRRPSTGNRSASSSSLTGTASENDENTPGPSQKKPSLTSRLLGKRKASAPLVEQPDPKRPVSAGRPEKLKNEIPSTSVSESSDDAPAESTSVAKPEEFRGGEDKQNSRQLDHGDGKPFCRTSDGTTAAVTEATPAGSVQRNSPKPEAFLIGDDDSFDEIDICDAPAVETPKKNAQIPGTNASPGKLDSPASSNSCPAATTPSKDKSPLPSAQKSPTMFNEHVSTASGSAHQFGFPLRAEIKSVSPVPCHYCPKIGFHMAVKTCLVCGASMCTEHLRPHLDSPVFKTHTLVPPVEDISSWRCQEHHEINRIYCRQCGVCVCTVCTVIGSHRNHICISIREAEKDLRSSLIEDIKKLQEAEEQVNHRLMELTQKKESFSVVLQVARTAVQQQYSVIREALDEEEQTALQCVSTEETKVMGSLQQKLGHLQSSLKSIQQGLHILEGLADAKGDNSIQDQAFIAEYSKTSHLAANTGRYLEQLEAPQEVNEAKLKCLQEWTEKRLDAVILTVSGKDRNFYRLHYGCVPTLDEDTAHAKLQLSDNKRTASYSEAQQAYSEHEARFSCFPQVLAAGALRSGRHYWEVRALTDEGRWKVGVCEAQIERKGQRDSSRLGCNPFSWCVASDRRRVEVLHNKAAEAVVVPADRLQTVGVFLDFEEGILSFFSVTPEGSLVPLHSYRQAFHEPLYPALSVSKTQLTFCDLFRP